MHRGFVRHHTISPFVLFPPLAGCLFPTLPHPTTSPMKVRQVVGMRGDKGKKGKEEGRKRTIELADKGFQLPTSAALNNLSLFLLHDLFIGIIKVLAL